jgi:hypothetical protein
VTGDGGVPTPALGKAPGAGEPGPKDAHLPRSGAVAEVVAAAGLSAFVFWGFRFLPLLGFAAIPAAALPLVRIAVRRGVRVAGLASAGAAALSGLLALSFRAGTEQALAEVILSLALTGSCALAAALSRRSGPSPAFLGLAAYGVLLAAAFWGLNPSAHKDLSDLFEASSRQWLASSRSSGADAATLRQMRETLDSVRTVILEYAPGFFAAAWVLLSAVAFFLGRRLAAGPGRPMEGGFASLRLPAGLAAVFVAVGATSILGAGALKTAARELLMPLALLYFLAGLSIITHFARRWFRSRLMRGVLYAAACWFPFSALTAGVGLFDWYFDFRGRADRQGRSQ